MISLALSNLFDTQTAAKLAYLHIQLENKFIKLTPHIAKMHIVLQDRDSALEVLVIALMVFSILTTFVEPIKTPCGNCVLLSNHNSTHRWNATTTTTTTTTTKAPLQSKNQTKNVIHKKKSRKSRRKVKTKTTTTSTTTTPPPSRYYNEAERQAAIDDWAESAYLVNFSDDPGPGMVIIEEFDEPSRKPKQATPLASSQSSARQTTTTREMVVVVIFPVSFLWLISLRWISATTI